MRGPFTLKLFGSFHFVAADGEVIAISGKRGRCLIVALLLSEDWSRDRLWLQTLLWPDRPKENASLSMRQELSALRRLLGEGVLISEGPRVRLDRAAILNDPLDPEAEHGPGEELLAGLSLPG